MKLLFHVVSLILKLWDRMEKILETVETNNPGQMAKQILERILLFTAGKVPDDMTVLVAGIWEK